MWFSRMAASIPEIGMVSLLFNLFLQLFADVNILFEGTQNSQ